MNSAAVAFVQAELWPIWVENGRIFVTMATMVDPMNLNSTNKSAVPENPLFGANPAALAFVQAELWPIWVKNGQNFKI